MNGRNAIWYSQAIDNSGLRQGEKEAKAIWNQMGDDAERTGMRIGNMWKGVLSTAAIAGFTKQMIQVRGEFQQLEIAFTTMLKSGEKATKLMSDLTQFAAETPFGLQSAASGAKQLLAYGSSAETVIDELRMLGDVAAGTGQSINDIVYLYGTLRTQGRAYLMDIRQFAGRGIPIYDELSKVLGVTKDQVNDFVSAGKVGFAEIEQAFKDMTSEAGLYGGLMEKQSTSVTGRIEQLTDAVDMMFNNIGKSSEGAVYSVISGATSLVENYEKVGKVLVGLIATYGSYRSAIIALSVVEKLRYQATLAQMAGMTKMQAVTDILRAKTAALNKTMLANPYVLITTLVVGLTASMWALSDSTSSVSKMQDKLDDSFRESQKNALAEQRELAKLKGELDALETGTDAYNSVKNKIITNYGKYYSGLQDEIEAVGLTAQMYDKLSTSILNSFNARQYEKFAAEQTEAMDDAISKNLSKLQDRLYDKLGDELGANIYTQIRNSLLQGGGITAEIQAELDKLQRKGTLNARSNLDSYVSAIQNAIKLNDEFDKRARERFGISNSGSDAEGGNSSEWKQLQSYSGSNKTSRTTNEEAGKDLLSQIEKLNTEILAFERSRIEDAVELARFEKEQKISAIEAERDAYISAQNKIKKEADPLVLELFDKRLLQARSEAIDQVFQAEIRSWDEQGAAMNNYLKEYGNYEQKRLAITQDYEKRISEARKKGIEGEALRLEREHQKELAQTNVEMIKSTGLWNSLFSDYEKKSLSSIKKIVAALREMVESVKDPKIKEEITRQLDDVVRKAEDAGNKIEKAFGNSKGAGVFNLIFGEGDFNSKIESLSNIFTGSKGGLKGAAGSSSEIAGNMGKASDSMSAMGKGAGSAMTMVDAIITAIYQTIKAVTEILVTVAELQASLGNDDSSENLKNWAEGMTIVNEGVMNSWEKFKSGDLMGAFSEATNMPLRMWTFFNQLHDRKIEKKIQKIQENVDDLGRSYDRLGRSIEKAYSVEASNLIEDQTANLVRQKNLIEEQLRLEEKKKDVDKKKVQEYKDSIEEINNSIEDSQDRIVEAIIGEDVKSAIDQFAAAYIDAWSAGEDKAAAVKDVVRNMIKSAVTELTKSKIKDSVTEFSTYLAEAMEDGFLSLTEQTILDQLEKKIFDKASEVNSQFDKWIKDAEDEDSLSREGTSRGIASASQDSIDELNGRMTVIQQHTFDLRENSNEIIIQMRQVMSHWSNLQLYTSQALRHLSGIENNTNYIPQMASQINDIATRGVKMRYNG